MQEMIRTERLQIMPYRETDGERLAELLTDQGIRQNYMLPDFSTREELTAMVKKLTALSHAKTHFERGLYLKDLLIGFVNDVEIARGRIELGYAVHPRFQNNGYATEMLRAAIDALFACRFTVVEAAAFADNTASLRVMQKCGMRKIDRESDVVYGGKTRRCVYYAICGGDRPCADSPLESETIRLCF